METTRPEITRDRFEYKYRINEDPNLHIFPIPRFAELPFSHAFRHESAILRPLWYAIGYNQDRQEAVVRVRYGNGGMNQDFISMSAGEYTSKFKKIQALGPDAYAKLEDILLS